MNVFCKSDLRTLHSSQRATEIDMRALTVTAVLGSLLAGGCNTAPGVIHGRTVDLYSEESAPGEGMDDFVVRIAPRALSASMTARATVCGQVQPAEDRYTLQIKTDGYVSECPLISSPHPYVLVNGTATSASEDHFSQRNWQRPGYLVTPWSVKHQDGVNKRPRLVR